MYRVGLLADGTSVHKLFADLTVWAERQPDIEMTALIIQRNPQHQTGKLSALRNMVRQLGVYGTVSRLVFARVIRLEERIALRTMRERKEPCDIGSKIPLHVNVSPIVSKSGFVYRYDDADLSTIRELNLDVLVRAGSGILKGGILSAARHGIISLHHGDNRINRGGPPGFWEVLERQPYTGFVIQRLTEELDGGDVLFRGSMATEFAYSRNQLLLFERSAIPLQNVIRRLADGTAAAEPPHIYSHRLYTYPLLADTLRYAAKTLWSWSKGLLSRLRGRKARWGIAYLNGNWDKAVLWRAKRVPNPPGHFLADPFALTAQDGSQYLFAEDYSYSAAKGSIAAYKVPAKGDAERLGIVLEEDFHLSFPFLFRHGTELYMCPETSQRRQIRLYRCVEFPLRWELEKVLVDDINAVDTIIFPHEGRWGMLTSVDSSGGAAYSELHAYMADDPLGTWSKVGNGPLFMDASRGRNGGLLQRGSAFFRVAQRPGFDFYGKAFSIYRIDRLDPDGYAETKIQDIEPEFMKGIEGTHHMHHDGAFVVFDFVRQERVG